MIENKCSSLPRLAILEELERGILAVHADKLNVELGFFVDRRVESDMYDYDMYHYDIRIKVSWYVHIQSYSANL